MSDSISNSDMSWTHQLKNIEILPVLGEGTFGKVLKIEYNNGYAALKIFKKELYSITLTEKDRKKIQNEIDMLTKANHENIVRVLEHGTTEKGNYIVMEFVDGGSLQRIVDSVPYTMVQAINWLQQAAKGLEHLHSQSIIHRDVKPQNMLVTKDLKTLKLCDFGESRILESTMTANRGTEYTLAPEVYQGQGHYNEKADIFSLGITMWQVIAHKMPYPEYRNANPMHLIHDVIQLNLRPDMEQLPKECPQSLKDLMKSCWKADPNERPNIKEIVRKLNDINL